jgi:DNA-binding beta-propeller fold protein YncE
MVVAGDGTEGFADGTAARFRKPIRLAPYGEGAVVVADIFNHAVRVVTLDGKVTTLAGGPDIQGHRDGPASDAQFSSPHGVAVSPDGAIAVADAESHTVRLITPPAASETGLGEYVVSTLAGVPGEEGMRDGPAAEALFNSPHAVAWAADGSLFVADIGNARIRRIADGEVTTVAGSGETGSDDGPALEASFTYPMDIAFAPDGSLVIIDAGSHQLRRWSPEGSVTTVSLDSPIETPHGVAVAPDGTVYIAEMGTHRVVAVSPSGTVTPVCGTGDPGADPQQLNRPAAVLVHDDRLWIADLDNHRISVLENLGGR